MAAHHCNSLQPLVTTGSANRKLSRKSDLAFEIDPAIATHAQPQPDRSLPAGRSLLSELRFRVTLATTSWQDLSGNQAEAGGGTSRSRGRRLEPIAAAGLPSARLVEPSQLRAGPGGDHGAEAPECCGRASRPQAGALHPGLGPVLVAASGARCPAQRVITWPRGIFLWDWFQVELGPLFWVK